MNEKGWKEATFGLEAGPNVVNKQNGQQMLDFNLAFCTKTCACHLHSLEQVKVKNSLLPSISSQWRKLHVVMLRTHCTNEENPTGVRQNTGGLPGTQGGKSLFSTEPFFLLK